jgi:hypothetical protein
MTIFPPITISILINREEEGYGWKDPLSSPRLILDVSAQFYYTLCFEKDVIS